MAAATTTRATTTRVMSFNADLELAERHRYGDLRAFDEVYERFSGLVYNLALRLAGDAEQAEDLSQEVFLRIFRHLGRFSGRSSLKTWIYRVTLNHCRSRLGRWRRWFQLPVDDDGNEKDEAVDTSRDPEERVLAQDAARRVGRALCEVRAEFREAVVLRDLEELAYEEIAEILDVPIGTVRSRIARGREQLRKVLEKEP